MDNGRHGRALIAGAGLGVALALSPACGRAQIPSGPWPNGLGIADHNLAETPAVLAMMYGIGIRTVRTDIPWQSVEPGPNKGSYDWAKFDSFVQNVTNAGMKVLFILDYSNTLYDCCDAKGRAYSPYTPSGIAGFTNYALAAVARYQGRGVIWEMYNEPTYFWYTPTANTTPEIAVQYSAMALAAGQAINAAYPNETLVGPAMANMDSQDAGNWQLSLGFLQSIFQAGDSTTWNAVSIHPYRWNYPESVSGDYGSITSLVGADTTNAPPVIDTEWGYTSAWYDSSQGGPYSYGAAEKLKGKFLARSLLINMANAVPLSIIYEWENQANLHYDPSGQSNFGLVATYTTSPTTFLPAFDAVNTLTGQLSGYTFASRIGTGNSSDFILAFTNGTSSAYACWTDLGRYAEFGSGKGHNVMVPVGANVAITVTSFDGKSVVKTTSGPDGYRCHETEGPQYIKPSP